MIYDGCIEDLPVRPGERSSAFYTAIVGGGLRSCEKHVNVFKLPSDCDGVVMLFWNNTEERVVTDCPHACLESASSGPDCQHF